MYHVPVNRPRSDSRRRLPLIGALQGAGFGFLMALAFGAALGGLGLLITGVFAFNGSASPDLGRGATVGLAMLALWMIGVAIVGGIPAAIIGFLTGLAIGLKLRGLEFCDNERARRIGRDISTNVILILNFIALTGFLFVSDIVALAWLLGSLLVFLWLPCLIYAVAAGRFAARLHQEYPV